MKTDNTALDREKIVNQVDAEVRRIADLFRLILKYREQFQPSGIEFSDLRTYLPSDDASRIDWKSSARTNDLYVKEYDVEKDTDTFIILDASSTMTFGTAEKLKSEYVAVLAATLAYASVDNGLNVGLGIYGKEKLFLEPDGGDRQYQRILREVTKPEYYGGTFNLEEALGDTLGRLKAKTSIFLLSDFIQVEGEWDADMKLASSKFRHLLSVMVRDLRDYKLPESGNMRFESPSRDTSTVVNTNRVREKFNKEVLEQEEKIEKSVKGAGSGFVKVDTRDSFGAEIASYFDEEGENW